MASEPCVTLVIPARFGSSRFPGKPLAVLAGKPLIQHVYSRALAVRNVDHVWVATDDDRICKVVEGFGGKAMMTEESFRTGTDRVAAVAQQLPGEIFVNLQGDEIPLHPGLLTDLITAFQTSGAGMGTLKRPLQCESELHNSHNVKVVTDQQGQALYFSRAPIPFLRNGEPRPVVAGLHYLHLGVYIYTRETLLHLANLPTSQLEEAEKLEQLRALEHGIPIRVWETAHRSLRVDRPEDIEEATKVLEGTVT